MRRSALAGNLLALGVLLAGVAVAFLFGRFPVSLPDVVRVLWAQLGGGPSGLPPAVETVVWQVRAPRRSS